MASGLTNVGKLRLLEMALRHTRDSAEYLDTSSMFFMALTTSAASLDASTTTFDTATQIPDTAGYADGGLAVGYGVTGFDVGAIDTAGGVNAGYVQLADVQWTASGTFPASGTGAYYAVLLDTAGTVGSRQVYGWIDMTTARSIGSGATLTLQDIEIRIA